MALDELDREWVQLTAKELAYKAMKEIVSEHIKTCPHGLMILRSKWLLFGFCISPIAGGGIGAMVIKLLSGP